MKILIINLFRIDISYPLFLVTKQPVGTAQLIRFLNGFCGPRNMTKTIVRGHLLPLWAEE